MEIPLDNQLCLHLLLGSNMPKHRIQAIVTIHWEIQIDFAIIVGGQIWYMGQKWKLFHVVCVDLSSDSFMFKNFTDGTLQLRVHFLLNREMCVGICLAWEHGRSPTLNVSSQEWRKLHMEAFMSMCTTYASESINWHDIRLHCNYIGCWKDQSDGWTL